MIAGSAGKAACSRSNSPFVLTEMPPDLFQGGTLTGRWIPHNLLCSLPLRNGAKGIKHCVKGRARKQRAESFKIPPAAAYSVCFINWDSKQNWGARAAALVGESPSCVLPDSFEIPVEFQPGALAAQSGRRRCRTKLLQRSGQPGGPPRSFRRLETLGSGMTFREEPWQLGCSFPAADT